MKTMMTSSRTVLYVNSYLNLSLCFTPCFKPFKCFTGGKCIKHRNLKWPTTFNPQQTHRYKLSLYFQNLLFSIYSFNNVSPFRAKCYVCFGNSVLTKTEFLTFESSLSNLGENFNIMRWMFFQGRERMWSKWIYALRKVPSKWELKCGLDLTKDRG